MKKVIVVTDSNSGITQEEAKQLGICVVAMPFYINEELFYEGITLSQEAFYGKLEGDADIFTSQPSPVDVTEVWDKLLKEYDEIVHIPMSSGLSNSCQTALMLAQDYAGTVFVVDNQRISVTMRQSVLDAVSLAKAGKGGQEIKEILEREKMLSSIYITLETLKYLKKGGRITPAAAAIGTVLNLKPVLQIQGEKLDSFSKARGKKQAKKIMIQAMKADLEGRFAEYEKQGLMCLEAAYSGNPEEAEEWLEELKQHFPDREIVLYPLSLSVSCHIGPGSLAIACAKKVEADGLEEL
ncbi:MAG: DegV family protein [Lachnospiraceae bacterium]